MPKLRANQGTNTALFSKSGNTEGDIYASTSYGGINIYTTLTPPMAETDNEEVVEPVQPAPKPTPEPPIVGPDNVPPSLLRLPDPNKTEVLADANDAVIFENLPIPTHWVTYQVGLGGSNEFDYEESSYELTFSPAGQYYLMITADGYEPKFVVVNALYTPPPEE